MLTNGKFCGGVGAALLLATVGYGVFRGDGRPFDRAVWLRRHEPAWESDRAYRADDLLRTRLKPGMAKADIIALLGKPDGTSQYDQERGTLGYYLGPRGNIAMDPAYLKITFDQQQRLRTATVEQG